VSLLAWKVLGINAGMGGRKRANLWEFERVLRNLGGFERKLIYLDFQ
jgi:hypothetical protein